MTSSEFAFQFRRGVKRNVDEERAHVSRQPLFQRNASISSTASLPFAGTNEASEIAELMKSPHGNIRHWCVQKNRELNQVQKQLENVQIERDQLRSSLNSSAAGVIHLKMVKRRLEVHVSLFTISSQQIASRGSQLGFRVYEELNSNGILRS